MSFRKRNVVLSGAPPGRLPPAPAAAAAKDNSKTTLPLQQRTTLAEAASSRGTAETQTRRPSSLGPPRWPVADKLELPPEEQAALEPIKERLRRDLDRARQQRHRPQQGPPLPLGPGTRPSSLDGRPITSTGTASLDQLLAGFGGLLLGHVLLVEEQGTTDFAGVVLRAFAAEGLVQGHHVHVLGFGPGWRAELPGLATGAAAAAAGEASTSAADSKMKIAWRYEALAARGAPVSSASASAPTPAASAVFCHTFDLTKRLAPADIKGTLHPFPLPDPLQLPAPGESSSFTSVETVLLHFLQGVRAALAATPPSSIHRVLLPHFLAPALYALDAWTFPHVLHLLHSLRTLLRAHSRRLVLALALPTTLYDRAPGANAYVGALERLCDNVIELVPLPPGVPTAKKPVDSAASSSSSSKMQGWVRVHKVQVYSELGGLGASPQGRALRENLCFSVSASRGLEVVPYSLPPVEDENRGEKALAKDDMEF